VASLKLGHTLAHWGQWGQTEAGSPGNYSLEEHGLVHRADFVDKMCWAGTLAGVEAIDGFVPEDRAAENDWADEVARNLVVSSLGVLEGR
jgi:hypothetical protein